MEKKTRMIDLVVAAGRKRQSKQTDFVHFGDTIPVYENFCFALALFRLKTAEAILEGKDLIDRLLGFQAPDGNFPVFLHHFPKCWDFKQGTKISFVLQYLLRLFGPVLGAQLKEKIELALQRIPMLEMTDPTQQIIKAQLDGQNSFSIPYNQHLQMVMGPLNHPQEQNDPQPHPVEWLLAEENYPPRLLKDYPVLLHCAPLFPLQTSSVTTDPVVYRFDETNAQLLWKGHSLAAFKAAKVEGQKIFFNLSQEAALYCNISDDAEIYVEGEKASVFRLGETLQIKTPDLTVNLKFELVGGTGDFCGHISRSNRPTQIACHGNQQYEAYDWKIFIRNLRNSENGFITVTIL
jgi:hypothetical protein